MKESSQLSQSKQAQVTKNNKETSKNKIKLTKLQKILICAIAGVLAVAMIISVAVFLRLPKLEKTIKDRFISIIEESKELNTIFFGVGLPVYYREDELSDRLGVYYDEDLISYNRVSEFSSYKYIDEIKEKARSIYSESYLAALYETAFDGVMTGNASVYLRFYESENTLYQSMLAKDFELNERIYDYSTMKIIRPSNSGYINVVVESYTINQPERVKVNLSFIYERGNWYLDSPTY